MSTRAQIAGTGVSMPERVVSNADLEKMVDTSDKWITTRTGIRERRIAGEGECLSQHVAAAARQALDAAEMKVEDIDLLLCATVTPDMLTPSTACYAQHILGATRAAAFDLSAGCSGFLYGLGTARAFIESGQAKNILLVGGELLSRFLNWEDRTTCVIFADGAGAVVLTPGQGEAGVLSSVLHSDGSLADLITIVGGGNRYPSTEDSVRRKENTIRMKGNETFKIAVRSIEEVSREALDLAGLTPEEVDVFIPHQANKRIIDAVGQRLGIDDERCYVNIERTGNTSSASIPIALHEVVQSGGIRPGQTLLMSAFGAGLTWAGSVVRWGRS